MTEKYKIGELAKKFGVSVQTIRFYEEKGLLTPTKDEHSGYRYYDNWNINYRHFCRIRLLLRSGAEIDKKTERGSGKVNRFMLEYI